MRADTAEIAEAWDRVYWLMADTLIELERELYAEARVESGDVYRRMRVVSRGRPVRRRTPDVRGDVSSFVVGQYVSV
jgi:nitric oxide dioxygenase